MTRADTDATRDARGTPFALRAVFWCVAFAFALPIFAHGCHRGDHDDEPAFVPLDRRALPLDPSE